MLLLAILTIIAHYSAMVNTSNRPLVSLYLRFHRLGNNCTSPSFKTAASTNARTAVIIIITGFEILNLFTTDWRHARHTNKSEREKRSDRRLSMFIHWRVLTITQTSIIKRAIIIGIPITLDKVRDLSILLIINTAPPLRILYSLFKKEIHNPFILSGHSRLWGSLLLYNLSPWSISTFLRILFSHDE